MPALEIDQQEYQIRQTVNTIFYHLQPFIARSNERDVMDWLYKFYTESDLVLISKAQLKQYQELEKHLIDTSPLGMFNNG